MNVMYADIVVVHRKYRIESSI